MTTKRTKVIPLIPQEPGEPKPKKSAKSVLAILEKGAAEQIEEDQAILEQAAAEQAAAEIEAELKAAGAEFIPEHTIKSTQLYRLQAPGMPEHQYPYPVEILDPQLLAHWKRGRVKEYCDRFKCIAQQVKSVA